MADTKYDFSDFDETPETEENSDESYDFSDFDDAPKVEAKAADKAPEKATPEEISKLRTAGSSAGDAALFGTSDKLGGMLFGLGDLAQKGLNTIAPDTFDKSTSQLNEELAAQGFSGDLGPTSSMDVYRQNRDEIQATQDQLAAANPKTALASALVGGGLSAGGLAGRAPGVASKLFTPFGQAAEGAGLGARMGMSAANTAPLALATALESNTADYTQGELPKADELAFTTGVGTAIGAAAPAVGGALGAAANSRVGTAISDTVSDGINSVKQFGRDLNPYNSIAKRVAPTQYELGKQGIDTSSSDFLPQVGKEADDITNMLKKGIIEDKQMLAAKQKQLDDLTVQHARSSDETTRNTINQQIKTLKDQKSQLEKSIRQAELLKRQNDNIKAGNEIQGKQSEANALKKQYAEQEKALKEQLKGATEADLAAKQQELDQALADNVIDLDTYKQQASLVEQKTGELVSARNKADLADIDRMVNGEKNAEAQRVAGGKKDFKIGKAKQQNIIDNKKADTAEWTDQVIEAKFNDLGDQFNVADDAMDAAGVKIDLHNDINTMLSALPKDSPDAIKFRELFNQQKTKGLDRLGFARVRNIVSDYANNKNVPAEVRFAMKDLIVDMRATQAKAIGDKAGPATLAKVLDLNKQFSKLTSLQKTFLSKQNAATSEKSAGLISMAEQGNERAILRDRAFRQNLAEVGDERLSKEILEPIDNVANEQMQLDASEYVPEESPEFAKKMQELLGQKEAVKARNVPSVMDEAIQKELANDVNYQNITKRIEDMKNSIEQVKAIKPEAGVTPEIRSAQKQLELLNNERSKMLQAKFSEIEALKQQQKGQKPLSIVTDEALQGSEERAALMKRITELETKKEMTSGGLTVDESTEMQELKNVLDASKNAQTYPQELTQVKNDNAISRQIYKLITDNKMDKTDRNLNLSQLLEDYNTRNPGKDLTGKIKLLQQKLEVLSPQQMESITEKDVIRVITSPKESLTDKFFEAITKPLQRRANTLGRLDVKNDNSVGKMADLADKANMPTLAGKIRNLMELPEQQRNQQLFLLNQIKSFRELNKKDENE